MDELMRPIRFGEDFLLREKDGLADGDHALAQLVVERLKQSVGADRGA
jgi:hypothetical protein